jgi:polysaccharide export outer membrane protein
MKHKFIGIAVIALLAMGTVVAQDKSAAPAEMQKSSSVAADPNYVIGAEDVLSISVWKEPDLTRSVPVRPDGKISLPLIDEVKAAGLTPKQLETELTTRFSHYIAAPQVSVIVADVRSQTFSIVGEVNRSGSFQLKQKTTMLEALAAAGGFKDFAKTKKIYVLRTKADGTKERLPFNYDKALKGEVPSFDVMAHDTIVVP